MLYDLTVPQFIKMLHNLSQLLDKAAAHADAKKFDAQALLQARLAPDQFHFQRQVQIACDSAKLGVARLTGKQKDAPVHEDNEKSIGELQARIASVVAYLQTFSAKDFEAAQAREISQPRWAGKTLTGLEFAVQHLIPNIYFHITTAYAILRHNGVEVGKQDYLGALPVKQPRTGIAIGS